MLGSRTLVFVALVACGGGSPQVADGGPKTDAALLEDAGSPGEASVEAGVAPRADIPAIACTDSIADVYVTPSPLPAMSDDARGDIVRCAPDSVIALQNVSSAVAAKGITTKMTSSVAIYRVAFRTWRGNGSAGVSTARVYLPLTARALPLPAIVAGHPTTGIADDDAPSVDPTSNEDLALPWAGIGHAIIVPDYAGLGNEGIQSYLDNHDQAHALLDGARALRKLLSKGALSDKVAIVGYSQGGGAALSAQALASTYGCDGTLEGVVAFAPEWPTRPNSFAFVNMLENPTALTITTGISFNVVEVMRAYAFFYNWVGPSHADDAFPASQRAGFDGAINTLSQVPLGGYLQANAALIGDFIDDAFRTSLLACIQNGGTDAACVGSGKQYFDFMTNDYVTPDPAGARVLYVQGLADYVMPAASEAACNVAFLKANNVTPQVCVDAPAQHETVVGRNMDFAITWLEALLANDALPACVANDVMPPCIP